MHPDRARLWRLFEVTWAALDFSAGVTHADFSRDRLLALALAHRLQVIGEAAYQVSPPTREQFPDIPWADIIAMYHRLFRDYLDFDSDVVWTTATKELPGLAMIVEHVLESQEILNEQP